MYGKSVKSGSHISRTYRIEKELGSGGSGAVYLAWHIRLRKHVVIKIVKNCLYGKAEVRRNEVEALKSIKSMHIPQVLDFVTVNDHSFTVMEYIDGESFDKLLRLGRRFPEEQIEKWYCQLASALTAIHKFNVCHRDIKPSNIMLTTCGDVYLIDFNSAFVGGNDTGMINRSMGYASPEQYEYFKVCRDAFAKTVLMYSHHIETVLLSNDCKTELVSGIGKPEQSDAYDPGSRNAGVIDWKLSDIYSLGATMYHFLTGKRPPVKADDVSKIINLNGYSRGILEIIYKSMKSDPSERFISAEELSYALWRIM